MKNNETTGSAIMPSEELQQLRIRNAQLEAENETLKKVICDYVANSPYVPSILVVNDYPEAKQQSGEALKFFSGKLKEKENG